MQRNTYIVTSHRERIHFGGGGCYWVCLFAVSHVESRKRTQYMEGGNTFTSATRPRGIAAKLNEIQHRLFLCPKSRMWIHLSGNESFCVLQSYIKFRSNFSTPRLILLYISFFVYYKSFSSFIATTLSRHLFPYHLPFFHYC